MTRKRSSRGRKDRSKRHPKRRHRRQVVKTKLVHAMTKLKNMGASRRVQEVAAAPDRLIHDMSTALRKVRKHKGTLPKHLSKQVKKHAKALRTLSNPRVSIKKEETSDWAERRWHFGVRLRVSSQLLVLS